MNEGEIRVGDNTFLIDISPLSDKYLSSNSLQSLNREVDLYSITLERVKGNQPVSPADLFVLAHVIASFLRDHPHSILCYYCDFLNPIPSIRKTRAPMTVQEYRSKLFRAVFHHYRDANSEYRQRVITIEGEENYYIHIIAHNSLTSQVSIIANDLQSAYGKD